MFTQCIECETILPVRAGELALAHGQVRCSSCGVVFLALESLCEDLDENGHVRTCFHSERPPTLADPRAGDRMIDDLFLSQPTEDSYEPEFYVAPPPPVPREIHDSAPPRWPRSLLWGAAALLLLAVLAGQWIRQEHRQQRWNPELRPWLQRACVVFGCRVPLPSDRSMIRLVGRNIRPHPSVAGALIISAAMQNQAPFAQSFPTVEIVLSNLSGNKVAMRRFGPAEYLDEGTSLEAGMPPQILLPLVFEVVDPGDDAVAFEFAFR